MLANGAKETTTTTGTGTVTLSAVTGFPRFSQVLSVGTFVDYAIQDGNNWEWGVGKVAASNTLERTLITAKFEGGTYSKNPATGLSLSGSATVFCTPSADTFGIARGGNSTTGLAPGKIWSANIVFTSAAVAGQNCAQNKLTYVPWVWPSGVQRIIKSLSVNVMLAGGTKMRIGITELGDQASEHRLIAQTADLDTSTTGIKTHTFSTPLYLPLDRYMMVLIFDGAPNLAGAQGIVPDPYSAILTTALYPRTRAESFGAFAGWTEITTAMAQNADVASSDTLRQIIVIVGQD